MLICFILFVIIETLNGQRRICEDEGTCRHCADNRYSYYQCNSQMDCFQGELCDGGFCCPYTHPIMALQSETSSSSKVFRTSLHPSITEEHKCPDGSSWSRKCQKDEECGTDKHCTEGKCCDTCARRRRLFMIRMKPDHEVLGTSIPQCADEKLYKKRQCLAGTDNCWCVTSYGRRISNADGECEFRRRKQDNPALRASKLQNEQRDNEKICDVFRPGSCPLSYLVPNNSSICLCDDDCYGKKKCCPSKQGNSACVHPDPSSFTMICGPNEQYSACSSPCQSSCSDLIVLPCPTPVCQPGCHCQPGFIRRDGSAHSPCIPRSSCPLSLDSTSTCTDKRRQYHSCGSACPISCDTRTEPRCDERCVSGCFCRIPYILENAADPLRSRCILASECPLSVYPRPTSQSISFFQSRYPADTLPAVAVASFYPTPQPPTLMPDRMTNQCSDPLKNYQSCGTKCPAGCNQPISSSTSCTLSCVSGCFCRAPYVLLDAKDANSACVLPKDCLSEEKPLISSCADPRKEWSQCGAKASCSPSCSNLSSECSSGSCTPGCVCRKPYVLHDGNDSTSRCILPSECENRCDDPLKEFVNCGSSCPIGCDNRHPRSCAPCQTGCYCINGFVFLNSSDWKSSKCIRLDECPLIDTNETSSIESSTGNSLNTTDINLISAINALFSTTPTNDLLGVKEAFVEESTTPDSPPLNGNCPASTFDVGGRACSSDADCPIEQHCCRPLISSLGVRPQRCSCPDKNAVWNSCGTPCPEYCGQPSKPVCSSTCSPGCHCAPGFVKYKNDVTAECVPLEECPQSQNQKSSQDDPLPIATMQEIPVKPMETFLHQQVASAYLMGANGVTGRLAFYKVNSSNLKINGVVHGLPPGEHAVVVHQFGDVSDGCTRIGQPMNFSSGRSPSLGDIQVSSNSAEFLRLVDWNIEDIMGSSVAIYRYSSTDFTLRSHEDRPLACGAIGRTVIS